MQYFTHIHIEYSNKGQVRFRLAIKLMKSTKFDKNHEFTCQNKLNINEDIDRYR